MTNLLEIQNIHHQVHPGFSIDLDKLFFQDGPIYALIGDNGAGKSTLLRILALQQPVDEGTVTVFGERSDARRKLVELRRRLGFLPQRPYLFSSTVSENVAMGLQFRGEAEEEIEARVSRLLQEFAMTEYAAMPVNRLSDGLRQTVALMRTLAPHPEFLLLDEPTKALDKDRYDHLVHYLKMLNDERGITMVVATKSRDFVERAVNISIHMRYGKVVRIRTGEHQTRSDNGTGLRAS